jgi:F-type H+-transporting ATPase subunit b
MKRFLLAIALCMSVLTARSFAQEARPAGAAASEHAEGAAAAAHEKAPLLPANGHDVEEHFLAPAIWTLVIFGIMLAILYPTAWKNVLAGLKKREQRIRSDIADAEATRAKAEATLKEYEKQLATAEDRVRQLIAGATADGEKLATNIRMKAQQEAEEIKERSVRDIEATKDAALKEIYAKTADLATSVAEKIIRRSLNAGDQQDLVRQSLDQLQSVNKN